MRIRSLLAAVLALCLAFVTTACSGDSEAVQRAGSNVTYDDIRNTGKANDCPTIADSARGSIPLTVGGQYELRDLCMHPLQVYAKEEPTNRRQVAEFVEGKILTRFTSSLDEVYGDLTVTEEGLQFQEKGGIDFQPITVLVPGGEEFPSPSQANRWMPRPRVLPSQPVPISKASTAPRATAPAISSTRKAAPSPQAFSTPRACGTGW